MQRWSLAVFIPAILLIPFRFVLAAEPEPDRPGWTFVLDDDALVPGNKDEDYTAGVALTIAGAQTARWPISLHAPLDSVLRGLGAGTLHHSFRIGGLAFTPADIDNDAVILDDRPYASLLFVSNSSVLERADATRAVHGSVQLGMLGLDLIAEFQRWLHKVEGAPDVRGWGHQISDGGEPTLQFNLGQQRLRSRAGSRVELKDGWDVSLGTETAAAYGWTLRWGRYDTLWWSHAPGQIGYLTPALPAVHDARRRRRELYLSGGARLKLRLYSAYLQGQFRDSEHRLAFDELRPATAEAWAGVTWEFLRGYRAGWVVRTQTSELRDGTGDRNLLYGGIFFSSDF
jgi:hypothetical protein